MLFATDQQTLDDLNIFGKRGGDSVYSFYNQTKTREGAAVLTEIFRQPLSDVASINKRVDIIKFFTNNHIDFPFDVAGLDTIRTYLDNRDERSKLSAQEHSVANRLTDLVAPDIETVTIIKGITALTEVLVTLRTFISTRHFCEETINKIAELIPVLSKPANSKFSKKELEEYDLMFRFRNYETIQTLLRHIAYIDVYCSIAKVANKQQLAFPQAHTGDVSLLVLEGVYHPLVRNAISNNITSDADRNVIFLTGANMAGKSTFMKSLSIALYLGHMGFPVPAGKMQFAVLDGLYTTINLPDNLGMGASHFYSEVLRVKKLAVELKSRNLFILFDELFRGTNVKDAHEATVALTEAFAGRKNSLFVVSSHIVEAGVILREQCDNIQFLFLPTKMLDNQPVYTYKLEEGITEDRHGMLIIKNEGILEILNNRQT